MMKALNYVDEIIISNDLDSRLETTNNLREKNYLHGFKFFVSTKLE